MLDQILNVVTSDGAIAAIAGALGGALVLAVGFFHETIKAFVKKTPTTIDDQILDAILAKVKASMAEQEKPKE